MGWFSVYKGMYGMVQIGEHLVYKNEMLPSLPGASTVNVMQDLQNLNG